MPTKTTSTKKSRPAKSSWPDWLPPGSPEPSILISRDELIDLANERGLDVQLHDIENWQQVGAIPYGVRRMYEGTVRTVYPLWAVNLIIYLRDLQDQGYRLDQIAQRARLAAQHFAASDGLFDLDEDLRAAGKSAAALRLDLPSMEDLERANDVVHLGAMLSRIADTHAARTGTPVIRAEFAIERDPDGRISNARLRLHQETGEDVQYDSSDRRSG